MTSLPHQDRLLEDAAQRARWNLDARLAGDRHGAWLRRVMILTVAPLLPNEEPPVGLKAGDQIVNLDGHRARIEQLTARAALPQP